MIPRSASQYAAAAKMKAIAISARMSRLYSTQANARSFLPQYTIYSPGCFLSCKVIPPSFKALRDNTIVLDNKNRGTFLIELIPRLSDGKGDKNSYIRIGLSAEDLGLAIDQLPKHEVEFVRNKEQGVEQLVTKVLRLSPTETNGLMISIDYEQEGVGGQVGGVNNAKGPLYVEADQAEALLLVEVMRTSIPELTGWSPMLNLAMKHRLDEAPP